MSLADIMREERRLAVLKILAKVGGTANSFVLRSALQELGHPCDHSQVLETLEWLAAGSLIRLELVDGGNGMRRASVTPDGMAVQAGRVIRHGVALPTLEG